MMLAFGEQLSGWDQSVVLVVVIGLCAIIHGVAYNAAEGALRPQRLLLTRGADLTALGAALAMAHMFWG